MQEWEEQLRTLAQRSARLDFEDDEESTDIDKVISEIDSIDINLSA